MVVPAGGVAADEDLELDDIYLLAGEGEEEETSFGL